MLEETLREWLNGAKREGQVELLLQQLEQRFGTLPREVRRRVETMTSPQDLGTLAQRILVAGSLAEMGLG